jgi:hypothetical protein
MRRSFAAVAAVLGVIGAGVAATPTAQARPQPLSITVTKVTATYATVKVTCPDDPPARIYFYGTLNGVTQAQFGITEPFHCTEHPQTFRLPLHGLVSGDVITNGVITFSGDSGEINGFLTNTFVIR